MSNEFKLLSVEPTQEMLDAITTERKKGNGALQCWYAAFGAAPQPPALGDDLDDALRDMASVACQSALSHGIGEHEFLKLARGVRQLVEAPLQTEIERLTKYAEAEAKGGDSAVEDALFIARKNRELRARNVHLEARCDEWAEAAKALSRSKHGCNEAQWERIHALIALSKPAGSEQ
ncbi:hypothetical protein [Pseudomonas viridiflava]|uniref:hypothetical protein n=1 Tax=Pseudomonas viridiflava TaxID=33069 RepID=UPI000F019DCE|nr:hypothetical protein [Pseudomonas viridiflava]